MRPRQKSTKLAIAIERDFVAGLGKALNEVDLHEVAVGAVVGEAFLARLVLTDEGLSALDDLSHLELDGGEIIGRERRGAIEVVEEAGVGAGPWPSLVSGKSSSTAVAITCAAEWRTTGWRRHPSR